MCILLINKNGKGGHNWKMVHFKMLTISTQFCTKRKRKITSTMIITFPCVLLYNVCPFGNHPKYYSSCLASPIMKSKWPHALHLQSHNYNHVSSGKYYIIQWQVIARFSQFFFFCILIQCYMYINEGSSY